MSGGSSANMRPSSSIVWRRAGELTSSEIANATAQSCSRPASAVALRASWMPSRAMSIQWLGSPCESRARCSASGAERIDQVAVESTLQPAARCPRWTSSTVSGAW